MEETLRSRNWVLYMLGSYYPAQLKPAFYAINLFDLELTKISENAREPALGTSLNNWSSRKTRFLEGNSFQNIQQIKTSALATIDFPASFNLPQSPYIRLFYENDIGESPLD